MALKVEKLVREFRYNGITLPDPGQERTPLEVRDIYAAAYPEITTAEVEGPERKGNKLVYSFRRAVGTKGAMPLRFCLQDVDGLKVVKVVPAGSKAPLLIRLKKSVGPKLDNLGRAIDKVLFA